jgi:hypothetical protein
LPTCVGLGYGLRLHSLEVFLGSIGLPTSPQLARHHVSGCCLADLPTRRPTRLSQVDQRLGWATFLRHPIASLLPGLSVDPPKGVSLSTPGSARARSRRYGNINPSSIDYASRPRLRSRLTLGGLTFPRNPWAFGGRVFHPSFVTHAGILTRCASTAGFPRRFTRASTLPYPPTRLDVQSLLCTPASV